MNAEPMLLDIVAIVAAASAVLAYFLGRRRLFRILIFVALVCIVLDRTIF